MTTTITPLHEYRTIDKTTWGQGRWQDEPDKQQWIDEATGLDCLIVRGRRGALCGYVGVPEGHPAYKRDYYEVDVTVHGGLTFSDHCAEGESESEGICHRPAAGRPDNVWWLGFDCSHAWDVTPAERADTLLRDAPMTAYRDLDYVQREVTELAHQLATLA